MAVKTNRWEALGSGLVGATVLTAIHEGARRRVPHAPRMDVIGMRALAGTMRKANRRPPKGRKLFRQAMAGDIMANAAYYSLVGLGGRDGAWRRGALLGLAAGLGAVLLPPRMGLGRQPGARRPATPAMTVAWYLAGGLAAAGAVRLLTRRRLPRDPYADL